jgi:hypothetical protein
MLANLKIICQFHAHSVHQNSVEIYWTEICRERLLTLITESSSRLLHLQFSADLTMYWFPVYRFRCMKFKPLVIWIWNQNIAISTIVGTSSHIKNTKYVLWYSEITPWYFSGSLIKLYFTQVIFCVSIIKCHQS